MNTRTLTLRAVFTILTALTLPALAVAQKSGYVWADNPTSAGYTPSPTYSFNSSGGAINITRSAVGTYTINFSGIGGNGSAGGNVLVTAYGSGSEACKVVSWNSGGADFIVNLRCFATNGMPVDTRYSARVVWSNATFGKNGYAWANNPTSLGYTPSPAYSFNSSGGAITINRSGVGAYTVNFSGIGGSGSAGGNVQVTAYGSGSEACKVVSWNSGGADFIANVRCFTTTGSAVDTQYSINVIF
jgi:carbon monoxide dehydrogenase subunit G